MKAQEEQIAQLTAQVKAQSAMIEKVSAQVALVQSAGRTVATSR